MAYDPTTLGAVLRAQFSTNIKVPAEPVGTLDACNLTFDDRGASKDEIVTVTVVPPQSAEDMTPAAVPPSGRAMTPINAQVKITNVRDVPMKFTGEDLRTLDNGDQRQVVLQQFIEQAQRTLRNEMSAAASTALSYGASRALGTAGKNPFAKDMNILVDARQVLRDNGAPMQDIHAVTNTTSYSSLLKQNVVQKAMEAGSDSERRSGIIRMQQGIASLHEDANIAAHTCGAGTGWLTNGSSSVNAVGTSQITVDNGIGTVNLGDVITFAGDTTNKYCVNPLQTATTQYVVPAGYTTGATTFAIGNPGLRTAINTANAITIDAVGSSFNPSYVFCRHALVGVARPPLGFDVSGIITTSTLIKDSYGYQYLFLESTQWGQVSWFVCIAYGFKVTQSEYVVLIEG